MSVCWSTRCSRNCSSSYLVATPATTSPAATSETVTSTSRTRSGSAASRARTLLPRQADRVPEPAHRLDQRRLPGAVQPLAKVADVGLDDAGIAVGVVAPDVIEDLGPAGH